MIYFMIFDLCSGFSGFEIMYSDLKENISLTITAQSGTAFLAPMQMQICRPFENMLSVSRGGRAGKDLLLFGRVEMINYALQSIQYLGYCAVNLTLVSFSL